MFHLLEFFARDDRAAHQTIGQLKPEHVLLSALKVLKEKLVMVDTHLSETLVEASFDSAQSAGDEEYQM